MISPDGNAEASPRARSMPASFVTVWPRVARPPPQARRSRARSRRTNGHRNYALRAAGCASAANAPAPTRGWNVRCRSPAPGGRRNAFAPRPRREQPVHRRCQPHHAQMITESGRRTHRFAVDPAAPAARAVFISPGASMPVPSVASPSAPSTSAETAQEPSPWLSATSSSVARRKPPPRREKRDRFEAIGLAGAVRPHQHHEIAAGLHASRAIITKMRQRQPVDTGRGHGWHVIAGLDPAIHRPRSAASRRIDIASRDCFA